MSAATDATTAAEKLIEAARAEGSDTLDLNVEECHALTHLPDSIAQLTNLKTLDLNNTQVTDLTPIAQMATMTTLTLYNTQVTDLTPIAQMTAMTELYLSNTQVTDLTPIAQMTAMTALFLNDTQVTDLTPIAQMTAMTTLNLGNTQVIDLTLIAQMTAMKGLGLSNTQVTDLTPIAKMTAMTRLTLNNTQVTDLTPIAQMTAMTGLDLDKTQVTDLTPIAQMTAMTWLDLDNTQVTDLRPIRSMEKLKTSPPFDGLTFKNTPATKSDPRLAEIAEIEDTKDRATQLFDYLDSLDPPAGYAPDKAEMPTPTVPAKTPAPLETTIQGNTLSRVPPQRNADNDATTEERAKQGWEELRDYRDSFGSSFNVSNYAPLPAILKSFDRALGGSYDSMRQIGVGMHGQRIILLSRDTGFLENLPTGGASELAGLAAAVDTFVNRFPDWISYQEDAEAKPPTAKDVTEIRPAFEGLGDTLKTSKNVDNDVSEEFCDEVTAVKDDPESEIEAKGLLASTRDVAVTLSETALADVKSGKSTKSFVQRAQKTGETELPKIIYYAGPGFAADMLGRMNPSLRSLARKFPKRMDWINSVLDYLGYDSCDPTTTTNPEN